MIQRVSFGLRFEDSSNAFSLEWTEKYIRIKNESLE